MVGEIKNHQNPDNGNEFKSKINELTQEIKELKDRNNDNDEFLGVFDISNQNLKESLWEALDNADKNTLDKLIAELNKIISADRDKFSTNHEAVKLLKILEYKQGEHIFKDYAKDKNLKNLYKIKDLKDNEIDSFKIYLVDNYQNQSVIRFYNFLISNKDNPRYPYKYKSILNDIFLALDKKVRLAEEQVAEEQVAEEDSNLADDEENSRLEELQKFSEIQDITEDKFNELCHREILKDEEIKQVIKYAIKEEYSALHLGNLTSITDEQAERLTSINTLWLPGLKKITDKQAEYLSNVNYLILGLTSITDEQMRILCEWKISSLDFQLLTSITDKQAEYLSNVESLGLNGLTSITDRQAEYLLNWKVKADLILSSLKELTDEQAKRLSNAENLVLSGLTSITDKQAELLWNWKVKRIMLEGLTSITDEQAKGLSNIDSIFLSWLTSITDKQAEYLSKTKGLLDLDGLTNITDKQAEYFSNHDDIRLKWVESMTDEQVALLCKNRVGCINFIKPFFFEAMDKWEDPFNEMIIPDEIVLPSNYITENDNNRVLRFDDLPEYIQFEMLDRIIIRYDRMLSSEVKNLTENNPDITYDNLLESEKLHQIIAGLYKAFYKLMKKTTIDYESLSEDKQITIFNTIFKKEYWFENFEIDNENIDEDLLKDLEKSYDTIRESKRNASLTLWVKSLTDEQAKYLSSFMNLFLPNLEIITDEQLEILCNWNLLQLNLGEMELTERQKEYMSKIDSPMSIEWKIRE